MSETLTNQSSVFPSGRSDSSLFPVFVSRFTDPVDLGVPSDSLVEGVDEDGFVVLEGGILTNPVGANDPQSSCNSSSKSGLCHGLMVPDRLDLVHSLALGFSKHCSLLHLFLPTSSPDPDPVDHEALFGFVSQSPRLLRSRRSR